MKTISLKLDPAQIHWLKAQARVRRISSGQVVRDLIEERRHGRDKPSLYERSQDLCGCLDGPRKLSTRLLNGYGRD
ncbi:MAG: hypothetical protein ACYDH9_25295 [Limisphaerales bacterium]